MTTLVARAHWVMVGMALALLALVAVDVHLDRRNADRGRM